MLIMGNTRELLTSLPIPRAGLIALSVKHVQDFNACAVSLVVKHVISGGELANARSEGFRYNTRLGLP